MKKPKTPKQSRTTSKKSSRKISEDELKQVSGGLRRRLGADDARYSKVGGGQLSNTSWDIVGSKAT